jgi:hypothetical protein
MVYRICYDDGPVSGARDQDPVQRTEYFRTEFEALKRARQLIEDGDHHGVAVHDDSGNILTGILLQLKLGAAIAD